MTKRNIRMSMIIVSVLVFGLLISKMVVRAGIASNGGPNPPPSTQEGEAQQPADQPNPDPPVTDFSRVPDLALIADDSTHYAATLDAGDTITFTYSYTVPQVVFNRGDILFVIDRTGSMNDEIITAKAAAIQIMNGIRENLPYAWFGVGSFMDYPGYFEYPGYADYYGDASWTDLPWILGINPTDNITDVANTINSLTLGNGSDWPEDYSRALYETRFVDWRADSKKIVVLFGDAPTHDLDFAGYNFGGDPGRDAIAQTDDDLDFETIISQLATDGISVIAVDSGYSLESAATFKGMSVGFDTASGTGGLYYYLSETSQLPDKVVELIQSETGTIDKMLINYTPAYTAWMTTVPASYEDLSPNTTVNFDIRVTVPDGTDPGFYPFVGTVEGDGQILKFIYFEITVPGESGDLDLDYRPGNDGYSFDNFDDESDWYTELSWDMFQQLYGADQVLHPNGDRIGMAQYYFDHTYKEYSSRGHCDGFSSTSILNYLGMTPSNAGEYALPHYDKLWDVDLDATVRDSLNFAQSIQSSAEFLAQMSATCDVLDNSPKAYFNYLKSLFENDQAAVVAVYWYIDGKRVGHALLPYRLEEDPDHHRNYIYVYDSNDPKEWWDTEHRIEIDTNNDTWTYDIQTLWFVGIETITGDKNECRLNVRPLDLYTHKGVPRWDIVYATSSVEAGSTIPEYKSFTVYGPTQLLFIDDIGRRLGWQDDTYYEEIPGGLYIPVNSGFDDLGGTYVIPEAIQYNLALIGANAGTGGLDYWHGNTLFSLRDIELYDGMTVGVTLSADQTSIELQSIEGTVQVDLIASNLKIGEDVALHATDLAIEEGRYASLGFAPVSELEPALSDLVTLSTNNLAPQNVGIGLIHRGGEGYSAFSNPKAMLVEGSTATITITDWQNLDKIAVNTDLDGDGYPDTTQTLGNVSQASAIELQADRIQVYASETIHLAALVRDQLGVPVNNGTPVEFHTTLGTLSALDGETSGGLVTVILDADGNWGTATITASIPGTDVMTTIEVVFISRTLHLPLIVH